MLNRNSDLGKILSCPRTLEEAYEEIYKLREKDKLIALQAMNKELNNQQSINQ
jgi:hypothetical protein